MKVYQVVTRAEDEYGIYVATQSALFFNKETAQKCLDYIRSLAGADVYPDSKILSAAEDDRISDLCCWTYEASYPNEHGSYRGGLKDVCIEELEILDRFTTERLYG